MYGGWEVWELGGMGVGKLQGMGVVRLSGLIGYPFAKTSGYLVIRFLSLESNVFRLLTSVFRLLFPIP